MTMEQPEPARLRDRNRELTRRHVIEAYAELSLEKGFNNFTMQDIADRVGISHRTLYRHFENREAIVAGLEAEVTAAVFDPRPEELRKTGEVLRHNYRVFGEYRKPMLVFSLMIEAGMLSAPGRGARTDRVRRVVNDRGQHLSDLGRRQLVGLLRLVAGSTAWARLTSDEIGLDDEEAAAASAWALQTLVDAAAKSDAEDFS